MASQDCGGDWKRYGDTCYLVRSRVNVWGEARKDCQTYSGDLAVLKDKKTNVSIRYQKNDGMRYARDVCGLGSGVERSQKFQGSLGLPDIEKLKVLTFFLCIRCIEMNQNIFKDHFGPLSMHAFL